MTSDPKWHKSSYSGVDSANCVEVSEGPHTLVRDTQHRHLTTLTFSTEAWNNFVAGLKSYAL